MEGGFGELFGAIGEFFGGASEAAEGGATVAAGAVAAAAVIKYGAKDDDGKAPSYARRLTGARRALNINDL